MTTKNQESLSREELKPCPFCGGAGQAYDDAPDNEFGGSDPRWVASCTKCGACLDGIFDDESDAIKQWNTRTPTDRQHEAERLLGVALEALTEVQPHVRTYHSAKLGRRMLTSAITAIKSFMENGK